MKGKVVMKLEGVMVEVILKINPSKYKKYSITENSKDIIYVILTKPLYMSPFKQHYYFGKTYPCN
jgi:hypothetical protein